jgi:filamentous hemagglutinin family protein
MSAASRRTKLDALGSISLLALVTSAMPDRADASPENGVVVEGSASIVATGAQTTITQTTELGVIDWASFSIAASEGVSFLQPGASSITLNRVVGGNLSEIYGTLSANGRLVLVNPNGILFGEGAVVDLGGLVATTADISNADFMAGRLVFDRPGAPAASVANFGRITARDAGVVAFVAPHVRNSGVITANLGSVELAAGTRFTLDLYGDDLISFAVGSDVVELTRDANGDPVAALVEADGDILAGGGRIALSAQAARGLIDDAILADGTFLATSARAQGGTIVLHGGASGAVQASGTFDASGSAGGAILLSGERVFADGVIASDGRLPPTAPSPTIRRTSPRENLARIADEPAKALQTDLAATTGGRVSIDGEKWVSVGGAVSASGGAGGSISVEAGGLSLAGSIAATGEAGAGGAIEIESEGSALVFSTAAVDVSGASGGAIRQTAGSQITTSGRYEARGESGAGGTIDMTAPVVKLLTAKIDASGEAGGGAVRVGGEFQGGRGLLLDELANAATLVATTGTRIDASARGASGDGGTVILWSDEKTVFLGAIDVRPGELLGAGGLAEISSGGNLAYNGLVEASLPGRAGALLLDPKNITIVDSTFDQLSLILGYNYAGSPSALSGSGRVDSADGFGAGVSLDGLRLAVGADSDDGSGDAVTDAGAVYLFSFSDLSFGGGALEAVIGAGYTGGKNIDVAQLDTGDFFGQRVSLDGSRLAVGSPGDDGSSDSVADSGAVYLFTFSDTTFSGGALEATIGDGYTSGKNIDLSQLDAGDELVAVSLDGNRLAAGAPGDGGAANACINCGAAYLFTFTDSVFSGGVLEATIGDGYVGGKNFDLAALEASDYFGGAISLDGTRLAAGANQDDGAGNAATDSGAAYLFTFADAAFSGPTLEATIGDGYVGGKNIDLSQLEANDLFGHGVALDGTRLAVAAAADNGFSNTVAASGAVYLFSFADAAFSGGLLEATIGDGYSGGKNIGLSQLDVDDAFGFDVSLDGTRLAVGAYGDDGNGNGFTDAGAAYLFTFSDTVFNGGALAATLGAAYTGANDIDLAPALDFSDRFGEAVSLNGTRLAVGSVWDGGAGNTNFRTGAVYLFEFADLLFNSPTLEAIVGKGYTGGKNLDVASLVDNEVFGSAVSLDGNRLAVGSAENLFRRGNVRLFSFTDASFSGGVLEATIGDGYVGGKNIDVSQIENGDFFGFGVSLSGNRLAVGAFGDDGFGNAVSNSGAVYLFAFSDAVFSGGVIEATVGDGYSGGKNIDFSALGASSGFGRSVSLDGFNLAVGAFDFDADSAVATDEGGVHVFSFSDAAFSGGTFEASIGDGYIGGKNLDLSLLELGDLFGHGVSLDGTRLFVGAPGDDGAGNANSNAGAAYVISFADTSFNGAVLEGTIGKGYAGANDIDLSNLSGGDALGTGVSVDSDRLAIGADLDDGFGDTRSNSGTVYLFNLLSPPTNASFSDNSSGESFISVASLKTLLDAGTAVVLQANNDLTLDADLIINNPGGDGGDITFQAGRSILINFDIVSDNGDVTIRANETMANGVVDAERDPGTAVITMGAGTKIDAGSGDVRMTLADGAGKTHTASGDIYVRDIDPGLILIENLGTGGVILDGVLATPGALGTTIVVAAPNGNFTNAYGVGAIDPGLGRFLIYTPSPASNTYNGVVADPYYNTIYNPATPTSVSGGGNRFAYSLAPNLTVDADDATRVYGDPNPGLSATITGYLFGDAPSSTSGSPSFSSPGLLPAANAGPYQLLPSLGTLVSDFNYGFSFTDGLFIVTQAPLLVTAVDASRTEADPNPAFSATYSGFRLSDTSAVISGAPSLSTTATAASPPGAYPIVAAAGTLFALNYSFNFQDGTLTVVAAPPPPSSPPPDNLGEISADPGEASEESGEEGGPLEDEEEAEDAVFAEIDAANAEQAPATPVYDDAEAGETAATLAGATVIDNSAAAALVEVYEPPQQSRLAVDWEAAEDARERQAAEGVVAPMPADASGLDAANLPVLIPAIADPSSLSIHSAGDTYYATFESGGEKFAIYGSRILTKFHGYIAEPPSIYEIVRMEYGISVGVSVYGAVYQVTLFCHEDHTELELEDHDLTSIQQAVRQLAVLIGAAGEARP